MTSRDKPLVYVSTDIETNGFQVGKNSILSLASAAFLEDKTLLSTFSVNLETLPEGVENEITMAWWRKQPEAWEACRLNCIKPELGIRDYVEWLKQLPGKPVFVGYPIAFDFTFVVYYLGRYAQENPFGFSAIDLRSLFMGLKQTHFLESQKQHWPTTWLEDKLHTHIALDDAIEQGTAFCNMLAELKR